MCGIVGYSGEFDPGLLARMSQAVAHRGPDGDGALLDTEAGIGLAHRRLAIIDLSPTGHQPMRDAEGRAVIIFNGEIYNFRELRKELESLGHVFRGHSDTEVLLHLYLAFGTEMLARLNGIYAFAIWDVTRRELFIARDGLGVKPLYYAQTQKGLVFASELKALLCESSVSRELNPVALARTLTFLWSPAPETILQGVKKLEPGMAMIVKQGRIGKLWRHYRLPNGVLKSVSAADSAAADLRAQIDRAVERQMVADVPIGAFLSGGLDSSAVVASARRFTSKRLQCFTIAFEDGAGEAEEGMAADLPYARKVAQHLDVDLHTVTVGPEMVDHLQDMIWHLDEPQADPAPLNALFICQLARSQGIKVLLSGAGGDDIFTGYRRHYALQQERYWSWMAAPLRGLMAEGVGLLPTRDPRLRRLRKAFAYAGASADQRIASYFFWLDPSSAVTLLLPEFRGALEASEVDAPLRQAMLDLPTGASRLDRMLHLDARYFLADHNLNYTDKMSMARGVEVRVPLLDPDLVAHAAAIPDAFKQNGASGKWIFKKAMEGRLPNEVIYRPKTGFGAPLRRWLRRELQPLADDILSSTALKRRGVFDPEAVARLVQRDRSGQIDATYPIFAILCIEIWCRIFLDDLGKTPVGKMSNRRESKYVREV